MRRDFICSRVQCADESLDGDAAVCANVFGPGQSQCPKPGYRAQPGHGRRKAIFADCDVGPLHIVRTTRNCALPLIIRA